MTTIGISRCPQANCSARAKTRLKIGLHPGVVRRSAMVNLMNDVDIKINVGVPLFAEREESADKQMEKIKDASYASSDRIFTTGMDLMEARSGMMELDGVVGGLMICSCTSWSTGAGKQAGALRAMQSLVLVHGWARSCSVWCSPADAGRLAENTDFRFCC